MSLNPLTIIKEATKAVPAVRYALGIAGISAVVALIYSSLKMDLRVAGWGVVVLLILMTILLLFARLASFENRLFVKPALFFLWAMVLLFITTSCLFVTSIFFSHPLDLSGYLKQRDGKQAQQDTRSTGTGIVDTLAKHVAVGLIEFEGESIDYILDNNNVPSIWKEWMGDDPQIFSNLTSVLDTLASFKRNFYYVPSYIDKKEKLIVNTLVKEVRLPRLAKYLAGTNPNVGESYSFYTTVKKAASLGFKVDSGLTQAFYNPEPVPLNDRLFGMIGADKASISFKDCDDRCASPSFRLYRYICRTNVPADFMVMNVGVQDECGGECGRIEGDMKYVIVDFSTPVLKMGAYMIKNNNREEIIISGIRLLTVSSDSLRFSDTTRLDTKTAEFRKTAVHLQPGQSLIIPAYISFHPMKIIKGFTELLEGNLWSELRGGYVYGKEYFLDSVTIGAETIRPMRAMKGNLAVLKYKGFVYGALGTCPYVFSYDSNKKAFVQQGTLIYKRNGRNKEGWDTLKLKYFEGSIQIKEIDREESFIDQVILRHDEADGKETLLYPDNPLLKSRDKSYLHLKRGDKVDVRFLWDKNKKMFAGTWYIYSYGYYVPYK